MITSAAASIRVADRPGPIVNVDDDVLFQELLQIAYQRSEVTNELRLYPTAYDCLVGLRADAEAGKPPPALVLADINIPGMSGFDLLTTLRRDPVLNELPQVAIFSCSNAQRDYDQAEAAGADAYYEKPLDMLSLRFVSATNRAGS